MTVQTLLRHRSNTSSPPDKHISYSQIKTYSMCSLKWWFSRYYSSEFTPATFIFGKSWHATVGEYYRNIYLGKTVTTDYLQNIFMTEYKKNDENIRYSKSSAPPTNEQIATMLNIFLESISPGKVIAIEQKVRCQLANGLPDLLGYIDLIELVTDENGYAAIHLVDFKTCARDPKDSLDADQLMLYFHAVNQSGLLNEFKLPIYLRFDYLIKTKCPGYGSLLIEPDNRQIERALSKVAQCWRGMDAGITYPCPGWMCSGCGYKSLCAKWPDALG